MKSAPLFLLALLIARACLAEGIVEHSFPPPNETRKAERVIDTVVAPKVMAYSFEGRLCATAGEDGHIRIWDAKTGEQGTGELVQTLRGHTGLVWGISFLSDGKTAASIGEDATVRTWDFATGKELEKSEMKIWNEGIVAIRPGATGMKDLQVAECTAGELRVWDCAKGEIAKTYFSGTPGGGETCVAWRPNGKEFVTGNPHGAVLRVDPERGVVWSSTPAANKAVKCVAASDTAVAAGLEDGTVLLWRGDSPQPVELKGGGKANAIAFGGKGDLLAVGAGKDVRVWDVPTGTLLCTDSGHTGEVVDVAINPNGQKMASADANGEMRYWTVPLGPIADADLAKIKAALPEKATATPKKPRKILVFWRADAILHKGGVVASNHAIELMGEKTGAYTADFAREYEALSPEVLKNYDAIVLNSTAHLAIPDAAKKALLDYANGGGGVVGIHAAIDTFKAWPEGAAIIGATFGGHPFTPAGTWAIKLEEPNHPLLAAFAGKDIKMHDEVYVMAEPFTRTDRRILMSLDLTDPATGAIAQPAKEGEKGERAHRPDNDYAVSWVKRFGQGRVFYCVFGHLGEPFQRPDVLKYYLDGIQYAVGDLAVDDSPRNDKR